MTYSGFIFAVAAHALQPLAVWSGSDTGLGQRLRAALEEAVSKSERFRSVAAPQGDAPSLLIDEMASAPGDIVRFRLTLFTGTPHGSRELWQGVKSCPAEELARCVREAVETIPAIPEG